MVVVTGIGLVSALGSSLEDSWQKLIAGKSGIQWHQPFSELEPYPLGLIAEQPAELKTLTDLVVDAALKDAGLVPPLPDCAVVIGSSRSHQGSWELLARQIYGNDIHQTAERHGGGSPNRCIWHSFSTHGRLCYRYLDPCSSRFTN
jgi:3-oxoacyl-[acyl-carrier-protein] synthase II